MSQVELLILGAGWTSEFLIPLLKFNNVSFAATSRNGREGTIPFNFDPASEDVEQYKSLPNAATVLVTFPVTENAKALVDGYRQTRTGIGGDVDANWIQLGSTGSFVQVWSPFPEHFITPNVLTRKGIRVDYRLGGPTHTRPARAQKYSRNGIAQACVCHRLASCRALGRKAESGWLGPKGCAEQERSRHEGYRSSVFVIR